MNKFANVAEGTPCTVNFATSHDVSEAAMGVLPAVIEFQCCATEGVPGLVYVRATPKGKRKPRTFRVHQDAITL